MDGKMIESEIAADMLTQQLARANKFDADGLDANRQGKLSANQGRTIMEALGLGMALLFAILGLLLACGIGFSSLNAENWAGAAIPLVIGVLLIGGIGYLLTLTKRTGTDKYLTNRKDALPRLFMMALDLIRSNVASVEGVTTRSHQQRIDRSRDRDGSTTEFQVDLYSYSVDGMEFYVEEAGYEAFPESGLQCRAYYLPLSKALINVQVLDQAPHNFEEQVGVQAPRAVALG